MFRPSCVVVSLLIATAAAQQPIGWASENGGTTGGAAGKIITVATATELVNNAKSSEAMTIRINGKITADRVNIASNKTIEGATTGATLDGSFVMNGNSGSRIKNIIIRNLVISKTTGSFEDIISMQNVDNVWIDHCDISDVRTTLDGLCDMTHACNYITISWTKFSYPTATPDHRLCMLISHSDDNEAEDLGKLKITLHHDWWADNIQERMPRMRFCQVHSFNNYFSTKENNYCIGAGKKAQVLVESNYFENVNRPHYFYDNDASAIIKINSDNQYVNTTGDKDEGQGTCFVPPYEYVPDKGSEVKKLVTEGVGPKFGAVHVQSPSIKQNRFAPGSLSDAGIVRHSCITLSGRNLGAADLTGKNMAPAILLTYRRLAHTPTDF